MEMVGQDNLMNVDDPTKVTSVYKDVSGFDVLPSSDCKSGMDLSGSLLAATGRTVTCRFFRTHRSWKEKQAGCLLKLTRPKGDSCWA